MDQNDNHKTIQGVAIALDTGFNMVGYAETELWRVTRAFKRAKLALEKAEGNEPLIILNGNNVIKCKALSRSLFPCKNKRVEILQEMYNNAVLELKLATLERDRQMALLRVLELTLNHELT